MISVIKKYPERIICLTEESTELLYTLGEQDRIVGISGFTERPKLAKKEKPKVSTFIDAKIDSILKLKPDLVIGFSDIQGTIAKQLIEAGITVLINNHRSIDETFTMLYHLGKLVGRAEDTLLLLEEIRKELNNIQALTRDYSIKPKVYFEEWYDPMISGIRWVSELIHIAGGEDIFPELGIGSLAKDRIIADPEEVIRRNPDIIFASWCGKRFKKNQLINRVGWNQITAVKEDHIYEINSTIILQPGLASLTEGVKLMHQVILQWQAKTI